MRPLKPALSTLLAASAVGLVLTGCRDDGRPLAAGSPIAWPATSEAPYPAGYQPARGDYDASPPPARIPVAHLASYDDGWAWAERSYWLDQAFYDTPPDYGFDYDGDQPWVWQTDDRWAMYGDPYGDDRYYYYYQPGAVRPYFIRDDQYGYGYDDVGRLVAIFSLLTGRQMPQSFLYERDPYASRYYQRAYLVREASLRAQPIVITRNIWLEQQPAIVRTQNIWIQQATRSPGWVQYRERRGDRDLRRFEGQRQRRLNTLVASAPAQQQKGWFGRGRQNDQDLRARAISSQQQARMADQLRAVERRQQQDRQDLAKRMPRDQRRTVEAQNREGRGQDRNLAKGVRQQAQDEQRPAQAQTAQERRNVQRDLAAKAHDRGRDQQQAAAENQQRGQQRQAEARGRQAQQQEQRQAEAQGRQQQRDLQRQAEAQARQQQQQAQRQAKGPGRQQQAQAQEQARGQHAQQQKARPQAQPSRGQEANAEPAAKGKGHDKKG